MIWLIFVVLYIPTTLRTSISKYARVVVIFLDVFSLLKNYFLKTTGPKEKVNKKKVDDEHMIFMTHSL